jgi:hypothetical protein
MSQEPFRDNPRPANDEPLYRWDDAKADLATEWAASQFTFPFHALLILAGHLLSLAWLKVGKAMGRA